MKTHTALKLRFYPNLEQKGVLQQWFGNCRFVYNWALDIRIKEYEDWVKQGKPDDFNWSNAYSLDKRLQELREGTEWLKETPANSLQQVLRNLDKAFKRMFTGVSSYPKFKSRSGSKQTIGFSNMQVTPNRVLDTGVSLPKPLGTIIPTFHQPIPKGRLLRTSISKDVTHYYIVLLYEVDECYHMRLPEHEIAPVCGVDLGVVQPLAVSWKSEYGEYNTKVLGVDERERLQCLELRRKRYQKAYARKLQSYKSRCKKSASKADSDTGEILRPSRSNLDKAKIKTQKAYQKERFYRTDWAHQVSSQLAQRFETIKFEDLQIGKMTKEGKGKSGLNREMLRLGLANVVRLTEYKANNYGRQVQFVNPRHTSQRCSGCGHIDKENRKSQAVFECTSCGVTLNADTNASRNILNRVPLAA